MGSDAGGPWRPGAYCVVAGLRHVVPYEHEFVVKVRHGRTILEALEAHVKFQRDRRDGGREHWASELARGSIAVASDVLRRLPTGGEIPRAWWSVPRSLDDPLPSPDPRLRVRRHVHEPAVPADVPEVLHEDAEIVIVDKPAGVPSLAGVGPGLSSKNDAVAILNAARSDAARSDDACFEEAAEPVAGTKRGRGEEEEEEPPPPTTTTTTTTTTATTTTARFSSSAPDPPSAGPSASASAAAMKTRHQRRRSQELFAVNRIDKPVSGVWILAKGSKKSAKARHWLGKPGRAHAKTYLALVRGEVRAPGFVADQPLRVCGETGRAAVGGEGAKDARTRVHVLATVDGAALRAATGTRGGGTGSDADSFFTGREKEAPSENDGALRRAAKASSASSASSEDRYTLVAALLEVAGRFHQIRCHLAHAGHAIVGDAAYERAAEAGEGCDATGERTRTHASTPPVPGGGGFVADDVFPCAGTFGYADDASGTLRGMFESAFRPNCAACVTALESLKAGPDAPGAPRVGARICLHALEYRFEFDGTTRRARVEKTPAFAADALRAAGWDEKRAASAEAVLAELPWGHGHGHGEGAEGVTTNRRAKGA